MTRMKIVAGAVVLLVATTVYGSPTGASLGINFAADEPSDILVEVPTAGRTAWRPACPATTKRAIGFPKRQACT